MMGWINHEDGMRLLTLLVASHGFMFLVGFGVASWRFMRKMEDMVKDLEPLLNSSNPGWAKAAEQILDYILDYFGGKLKKIRED